MSNNRTLIVTGAGRGIGAAIARQAGYQGWQVCVNYRSQANEAEAVVKDIERSGSKAIAVQADMSVEADILRMFETVDRELGPITGLVNNAAITGGANRVVDISQQTLEDLFRVNVLGVYICAREAVRRMSTAQGGQGGVIVNIGSIITRLGGAGLGVHYAASKAAVECFSRGLGMEVAGEGIRVNAVSPGVIDTDMHTSVGLPNRAKDAASAIPMKRAGQPDEVADVVVWLLSDAASYVTASVVEVSGGR